MRIAITIQELRAGDKLNGRTVTVVQRHTRLAIIYVDFEDGGKASYEWDTEMLVDRDIERIKRHGIF
jgi:hypothetical protein